MKDGFQGLKVAVVGALNTRGGVQSCMINLIRGLNDRGIIPDILWSSSPTWEILKQERIQVGYRHLPFPISWDLIDRLPGSLGYLLQVANTYQDNSLRAQYDFFYLFFSGFQVTPDTPHLRYLSGPPLLPQLIPYIPGLRGLPSNAARWFYRRFLREKWPYYEYIRQNNYVINSQYTAGLFEEAYGVRLPVVYPPINYNERSFRVDDLAQRDTITFFSRIVDYKRPEWVIDLAARFKDLRCIIMGSVTPQRAAFFAGLEEKARACGRPDIVFLDTPSNERVYQELARTRFFVFPAINEHFGMATPEAIASGAIPFVHDSGGQREIVDDQRLRFTDGDYYEKFAALLQLPDEELNNMRFRLREHVEQYNQDVFIEEMTSVLPTNAANVIVPLVKQTGGERAGLTSAVEGIREGGK